MRFVGARLLPYEGRACWRSTVYRRLIFALSLLALAAPAPAQLRADEMAYELRRPDEMGMTAKKDVPSHNVGSPHGDAVRPALSKDVLTVPDSIPTNARVAPLLETNGLIAPSGRPDVVGAFRFICQPGQVSYDDPIVFPGQPGKSHLHQWYGNTAANASSTYESLRTTGESTCVNILNRSAYWMPAMLDGKGHVVRPDFVSIYYKRPPANDPICQRTAKACVDLPRGLRMVFGHDVMTGRPATGGTHFDCNGEGATSGHFQTITEAAKGCPPGARLGAIISAPSCWDGKRLDSPNHRDHIADISYGSWGYPKCPATHPYIIPAFTMGAWYSVDRERADSWYLSSDEMPGMDRMPAGSTFHADWFGAWDDDILAKWTANCIDKLLSCNAGNLGNGSQMRQSGSFSWTTAQRLVPIPKRPGSTAP